MTEWKTNASNKLNEIKSNFSTKVSDIKSNVSTGWENMKTTVTTKMTEWKNNATNKLTEIKSGFSSKVSEIKSKWSTDFTNIKDKATSLMETAKSNVSTKLDHMKSAYSEKGGGTIDEQESVTAWDVLQKCLTTYRCECIIHSLTKTIDIYDRIGSDRGCYFMEGLNLRKISLKSDTYDFYTRIYPIGKDGITPEWLTGKDYIDNFQYSSKIKAYVWKDERYTNTTSLIEDATAKIEEMSRPYKAYTAEVVDLAKASEKYKDILLYGIGDTVTLVSKKTRTKEKQRIVKITEYPETPKKNTVEISNARKTFAEIQKEETAAATEEAISISNRATKKVLENYSTTEEIETKITASKKAVEAGVAYTLKNYYTSVQMDSLIKATKEEISQEVKHVEERRMSNMTDWKKVTGTQPERPEEIDRTSSPSTVYLRKNIEQVEKEVEGADGKIQTVTEWQYDEKEMTVEEYENMALMKSVVEENTSGIVESVTQFQKDAVIDEYTQQLIEEGLI